VYKGAVVSAARSIGRHGVPVHLVVGDDESGVFARIYGSSRYCASAASIPFSDDTAAWGRSVLAWAGERGFSARPLLIPMTDKVCTYVRDCHSALADVFDISMPDDGVMMTLMDKPRASELAKAHGLAVPAEFEVGDRDALMAAVDQVRFPAVVKPTWWRGRGTGSFRAAVCDDKAAAVEIGSQLLEDGAHLLVQERIPGGDDAVEVYMFYRSRDGRTLHGCTGTKIRQSPPGIGSMASGRAHDLPHVAALSNAFLAAIDYRGLGGVEFKRYNGTSYFIEVSVRPEGFHLLAMKAGVDLPWLAYQDAALDALPREPIPQRDASYVVTRAYAGLWWRHRHELPVVREYLGLFFRTRRAFDVWSWSDPLPAVAMVAVPILRRLTGKRA
jgi:predicted ATP-grasp superfamily ATP-dependent carboligase